ncbi:MAG: beta-propeller fold lactonase family protein, partial [Pseudomonadota bacterium]
FVYVTARGPVNLFSGPNWTSTDTRAASGAQSYFVPNTPGVALKFLELEQTAPIASAADLTLSFKHIYSLDWATSCYDVGVLEISTDGGTTWVDVLDAGGVFDAGGYDGVQNGLESNPLNGRAGWCRNSPGWGSGAFNDVEVDLSAVDFSNGSLLVRFGLGEGSSFGNPGWWIDDIRLFNDTVPAGSDIIADGAEGGSGGASITVLSRVTDDMAANFGDLAPADFIELPNGADLATMDSTGLSHYVGSAADQSITHFNRNVNTGALNFIETVELVASVEPPISADSLSGLAAMAVSEDGEHLIASGAAVDRLVVFRRSPLSGDLEAQQELELDEPANDPVTGGIVGVRGIAFSSDGQQVFTATSNNQLGVFDRRAPDPTFGFLEAIIDGENDGFTSEASGLLGARATAVSEDGRFVFVASFGQIASPQSGALVVLERDAGSTELGRHLRYRQTLRNNAGGVTGMDGAVDLTVVGNDIYVAAERSNAVTHFRQDSMTGVVSFVASYVNGGAITGMSGAAAVLASPNDQQVYVAGRFDHAIAIFSRDQVTGALTFAGEARNGEDGVIGMLGANAMAMSVDGNQLYVAARESNSVVVLDRDGDTLTYRQTFFDGTEGAVLTSPTGIAVTNLVQNRELTSEHVLVTSLDGNAVTVLKRLTDPTQPDLLGNVRFQQSLIDGVDGVEGLRSPRGIAVDPANDRVYVVSDDDDALVIFDRNTSTAGALFGNLAPLEIRRLGVGGVIGLDRPYGVAVFGAAQRNIYVASLGGQSLTAFVRRSGSSCPAAGSGNLAEEVLIAAGGTVQFVITGTINPGAEGVLDNTATLTSVPSDPINNTGDTSDSSDTATLVPRSELTVDKDNNQLSIVAGETTDYRIVVANDGPSHARNVRIRDLLSANPQFDASTAVWSCTAVGTGLLDREETVTEEGSNLAGLLGASGVAWTPAPNPLLTERVYATGVLGDALAVFSIDAVSGALVPENTLSLVQASAADCASPTGDPVCSLRGARAVTASADGDSVYVVSQVDNSITVIDVDDDAIGALDIVQVLDDGDANLSGLDQPTDIVVSADGGNVYVAAANTNSIFVFDRLPNGQLVFRDQVTTSVSILIGGVSDLVMGPEDAHVYAAGTNDAAVAVFARDGNGDLTHIQTRSSPSTPGLGGVSALAFDADGKQLYAVSRDDESIVVFNRNDDEMDAQFGRLLSGVSQRIDRGTVADLINPRDIVVSPDGSAAYVSAYGRNALLVFNRDRETGQL